MPLDKKSPIYTKLYETYYYTSQWTLLSRNTWIHDIIYHISSYSKYATGTLQQHSQRSPLPIQMLLHYYIPGNQMKSGLFLWHTSVLLIKSNYWMSHNIWKWRCDPHCNQHRPVNKEAAPWGAVFFLPGRDKYTKKHQYTKWQKIASLRVNSHQSGPLRYVKCMHNNGPQWMKNHACSIFCSCNASELRKCDGVSITAMW